VTYIFVISWVLIMIGELADKSQLLAMSLATRYKAWQVLVGIFGATFVVHFFTALVGQSIGGVLPDSLLPWLTGVLFVGFGVWTLRPERIEESDVERGARRFGPILATAVAFFFAELGDKTQIMTLTIAADPGTALAEYLRDAGPTVRSFLDATGIAPASTSAAGRFWAVTLGSTVGMVVADAIAIGLGRLMGARLPERTVRIVSGSFFILFGVVTVVSAYI